MKFRQKIQTSPEKVPLEMTPMIDVVFQLLVFFMLSFKIGAAEGDFNVTMPPPGAAGVSDQPLVTTIRVKLAAHPDGSLAAITFGELPVSDFAGLHQEVLALLGGGQVPEQATATDTTEVELDCDEILRYEYVIRAIDAVSGFRSQDGRIVRLVERVKFTPPEN